MLSIYWHSVRELREHYTCPVGGKKCTQSEHTGRMTKIKQEPLWRSMSADRTGAKPSQFWIMGAIINLLIIGSISFIYDSVLGVE